MKPVPPHQLLSAYLDGELSAREREEVERLLEQSPEARQELLELEQVGMLLRQLPREALPKSFAPKVLEACLSDTAIFESATPPPRTAHSKRTQPGSGTNPRGPQARNTSWRGFTSVAVAVSALGLIVLLSWPKSEHSNREDLAQKSSQTASADEKTLAQPPKAADDNLDMKLAGGDAIAVDALNDVRFRQQGQPEPLSKFSEEMPAQSTTITAAEASTGIGRGGANRGTLNVGDKELKDLPVGEIVSALDPQGEQVAVVKLVVADRKQALKDLKQLLQKHQIAHESPEELEKADARTEVSKAEDSELLAVYVETNENQLAFVMQDLQKDAVFEKLSIEPPVETDKIDSYFRDSNVRLNDESRHRMMRFGGMGGGAAPGPRALKMEEKKAEESPEPNPEPAAAKETAPEKSAARTEPPKPAPPSDPAKNGISGPDEPPAQPRPSVAAFGAAGADSLRESEGAAPAGDRAGNEVKRPTRNKQAPAEAAPANSTQRDLTLTPEDLKTLQMQLAEPKPQNPEEAQSQVPAVKRAISGKPVQVLFVLVDQAETASPPAIAPSKD